VRCRVSRTNWQAGARAGRSFSGEDIAIIRPEEIRQLQERHGLVIAENGKPITTRLSRASTEDQATGCSWPATSPR
jgi:type IV secretion system protein VirD4